MSDERRRGALAAALALRTSAEVRFDAGARHAYSTDASNFRQVPIGVVLPRTVEDVLTTVATCHEFGVPITHRGGGTSLAGQACNTAVIIDSSKHLRSIGELDVDRRTVTVQPGVVLDHLEAAIAPAGLTWGPDPSTHDRCTVGGMLGNDSCGPRSVTYGRASANVDRLDVVLSDATRLQVERLDEEELTERAGRAGRPGEVHRQLRDLRDRYDAEIRGGFPDIPRRVSGYDLTNLLPGRFDLARALVGTEGTVATILSARLKLNPVPAAVAVLALGFDDVADAGDAVPALRASRGVRAIEGLDQHVAAGVRADPRHRAVIADLPEGNAWLLCEFGGVSAAEAERAARRAAKELGALRFVVVVDRARMRAVWDARAAGLGATSRMGDRRYWPGWEDAAVAPEVVGDYLRDLRRLFAAYGFDPAIYGHFGDGCIHTRVAFDLRSAGGVVTYRRFMEDAADLVVAHGGSLSGEHGDGQQRGELLERMYGPALVTAMREFKAILDPAGLMNPGKVVDARPLDHDLRLQAAARATEPATRLTFAEGWLGEQERCVGVGACRADVDRGAMCPSYQATRDETHSPRGRARLLFEALQPDADLDGWRDEHVRRALELCLSCKACTAECPVGVDIPTYKAEYLHQHHAGRRRPRTHLVLGLIHRWARLGSLVPTTVNALLDAPVLGDAVKRMAGISTARAHPRLAQRTFRSWFAGYVPAARGAPPVVLFPDTWTDRFQPRVGRAAVRVLEAAGYRVELPDGWACCGRPLYDAGMLEQADRELERLVDALHPAVAAGRRVVVLEPSCLAVFRDELLHLRPDDPRARAVNDACVSLGELLALDGAAGRPAPTSTGRRAVVHPHCHARALSDTAADARALERSGIAAEIVDAGCCGLAGGFGYEAGERARVADAVGEHRLAPLLRGLPDDRDVVADGFSCRSQIDHLVPGRRPRHLAEVLDPAPDGADGGRGVAARELAVLGGTLITVIAALRARRARS